MELTDKQRRALILVGIILGPALLGGGIVFAAFLDNSVPVTAPVTVHAPTGPAVTINQDADVEMADMFPNASAVEIVSSQGNITAVGDNYANVTVDNINGTWTNTSSLEVSGKSLKLSPGDKSAVNVSGGTTDLAWRQSMAADDGTVDFVYSASSTDGQVTIRGLSGTTTYGAVDPSTNTLLDTGTSDGSGTVTFDALDTGSHNVEIQTSAGGPTVSNRDPADGANLDSDTVTLSADINDPDLPADNVTVEWYVDNTLEATEYIQSNQTVDHDTTISLGGAHTWRIELEDAYGNTLSTSQFTMEAPSNLSIRKELSPDELVNDSEVEIIAYYSGQIQRRTTTNGNVSLTGFPIDEPIIVRVNASGYYTRTAIVESVFNQNSVYLLNNSTPTYLVRFNLEDISGQFPRNNQTVLFVERDLYRSGTTSWQIIAGDNFGVQGVPVNLARDERYRLRVKNLETGDVTVVGAYTAIQSETVNVQPQAPDPDPGNVDRDYYWSFAQDNDNNKITFEYTDETDSTVQVKLTLFERYNTSNILLDNDTFTSNQITYDVALSNAEANKTWMAELYVDRGDGFTRYLVPVSGGGVSLIPSNLDSVWVQAIGVFIMLVTAMAFSQLNVAVGAITTPLVGGALWWFGVFSGEAAGASIAIALVIGVAYYGLTRRGL